MLGYLPKIDFRGKKNKERVNIFIYLWLYQLILYENDATNQWLWLRLEGSILRPQNDQHWILIIWPYSKNIVVGPASWLAKEHVIVNWSLRFCLHFRPFKGATGRVWILTFYLFLFDLSFWRSFHSTSTRQNINEPRSKTIIGPVSEAGLVSFKQELAQVLVKLGFST